MLRFLLVAIMAWTTSTAAFANASSAASEPTTLTGKVTAVTVYQGQALVTREVELQGASGLVEVVVTDLPARVTPGSLYAEPMGDLEIRSVRYRVRPVAEDTREEVRDLDEQIQTVRDELAAVQAQERLLQERSGYLHKLENFTTQTASRELTSGVLDATTLRELTKTIFEGRAEIAERRLELEKSKRVLNERLKVLTRQRQQITSTASESIREAVVFARVAAGPAKLRLTYLVSGATWSPSYNLRASEARDEVTVEYNASIQQQSGEDWTDVAMTLSTASPSLVATAPSLLPLSVRLGVAERKDSSGLGRDSQSYELSRRQLAEQQKVLSDNRRSAAANVPATIADGLVSDGMQSASEASNFELFMDQSQARGSGFGGGGFGAAMGDFGSQVARTDLGLNYFGNRIQLLECAPGTVAPRRERTKKRTDEGISVAYKLANRTSLPSRADQQLIPIASLPLAGDFYRVARPVLTEYVYEEAQVTNDTDVVLLAGPAATFLGDRFVGRGAVPTVAIGEPFVIGLGIDESLRATRELVNKDRRVQGGNRVVQLDYQLVIENFGDAPAAVRLYDRLPSAGNGSSDSEIKVTLLSSKPEPTPPATDPAAGYSEKDRKQGILRWDVEAPAKDKSAGRMAVDYAVQLEYDKNRTIVEAPAK